MKIAILSMQRVNNFGSLLQAYSLKSILESAGHTVSFLDIERREKDDVLMANKLVFSKEQEKHKATGKRPKLDIYFLNRYLIKKANRKQNALFEEFRRQILGITDDANEQHYDYCMIGSDEVFNCAASNPWGFTSQLFGNVQQADRVFSYAASCGSTHAEMLPETAFDKVQSAMSKLKMVSVRDQNTLDFAHAVLGEESAVRHFDPVVIADFSQELGQSKIDQKLPKKYCIIYAYYNRINKPEEIKAIRKFCKENGLTIVTVGAPQYWVSKHLVLKPFEMLKVFQNSEFVITDTFHGAIFSAKYAGRFAVMARPSNKEKLLDLLENLNIKKHLVSDFCDLSFNADSFKNDFSGIRLIEKKERVRSIQDIENALK